MRVFTAYLAHETNSFSPIPTSKASYESLGIFTVDKGNPADFPELLKGTSHFYHEAIRRGDDIVVGFSAHAQPSLPTNKQDYEHLRGQLLESLRTAGNVDAILLFMHGSMMAEGYDDCEGDVLMHIRDIVGHEIPIGLLLDLHCNITPRMLENATFVKACKEYPHTDFDQRARELYDLCARTNNKSIEPMVGFARAPMLGLFQTHNSHMRKFIDDIVQREKDAGMLSISVAHGFPWSDFPDVGASVIVYTDGDADLADRVAHELRDEFFSLRETGQAKTTSVNAAIDKALNSGSGTSIIADMADNPGGGAASDSTFILRALLDRGVKGALVAYLWDPSAVDMAFEAGENALLPLRIGGKVGPFSGDPIDVEARILRLRTDATQPHIADGGSTPLGKTALIEVDGVQIIMNNIRQQPFSPRGLIEAGVVDPWSMKVIVVKSSHHFYAAFEGGAARFIYCDAPGTLNSDVSKRPYKRIRRPIWPLDEISECSSQHAAVAE